MTRVWLFVVAGLCFLGSLLCIHLARPVAPPDLWTERPVFDHGELSQGQVVQTAFVLVNHFAQALEIQRVVTSCSCSKAKLSTTHVGPDEQVSVTTLWKIGKVRGRSAANLQVVFKLADGATSYKLLRIQGDVVPDVRYQPGELLFESGKVGTRTVHLSAGREKEFTVRKVLCNHPGFAAALRDKNTVEVSFSPDKWVAEDESEPRLIVETDSVNEPQMLIPIKVSKGKLAS